MKCHKNGGCPMRYEGTGAYYCPSKDGLILSKAVTDCHLTPDDFDLLNAMRAGEAKVEHFTSGVAPAYLKAEKWVVTCVKPKGGDEG
jgi:hypothetical protein